MAAVVPGGGAPWRIAVTAADGTAEDDWSTGIPASTTVAALAVGAGDHVFVAPAGTPSGALVHEHRMDGTFVRDLGAGGGAAVADVAASDDGVFVLRADGQVDRFGPDGVARAGFPGGFGIQTSAIAIDRAGHALDVLGWRAGARLVRRLGLDGTLLDEWPAPVGTDLGVDEAGDVYLFQAPMTMQRFSAGGSLEAASWMLDVGAAADVRGGVMASSDGAGGVRRYTIGGVVARDWSWIRYRAVVGIPEPLEAPYLPVLATAVRHEWDLDGNGTFEIDTGATNAAKATFARPGTNVVSLRVTTDLGTTTTISTTLDVLPGIVIGPIAWSQNVSASLPAYTSSRSVRLTVGFEQPTGFMWVGDDPALTGAPARDPQVPLTWRLPPGDGPHTVYVRFQGVERILSATTVLDTARPVVRRTRVAHRRLLVTARDGRSGVAGVQVTASRKRPGAVRSATRRIVLPKRAARVFVRALDRAGNASAWRAVRVG